MHIKQLIISGFRSFRSQNEIETFSPKHNVIVGRNGSGKSNYFDAIQFVLLGPKFATLRPEDRQLLLHNGAGSSVMAAYVEIVFDNSDGRLSVESEEVILRRLVGLKKEEFYLNRKRVQKSEVMSLLESAGFSKSNPYYIVQQGKVANLCVMKDKDRLNLLKEVAGTTVYEERRAESVKIMLDTANKKEKVEEVLVILEERLGELEQEKQEFAEYEQLERQRRALEFSSYNHEFQKASEQLHQIDRVRDTENDRQSTLYTDLSTITDRLTTQEEQFATVTASLARLQTRRDAKASEVSDLTARRSAVEVEMQETEAAARAAGTESAKLTEQLQEVLKQARVCENQLREIEPEFAAKTAELGETEAELVSVRTQVETLYGKQGRGKQFRTKAERDAFLQQQIDTLSAQIAQKTSLLHRSSGEVTAEEVRLQKEKESIDRAEEASRARSTRLEDLGGLIRERMSQRNDLQEARKTTWKELELAQEKISEARQELEKGKQQLNRSLPKHIIQGLQAVEEIVAQKKISGCHGPLIDNIELQDANFRNAVEVAAGNALFHVIVDNDDIAATLINELERLKAGRLTFLPLNRLHNPTITYPQSNEVAPLMDVALSFRPHVEKAVRQVFGHKLLAKDLDTAARYSKECDLDALTREGDQVNRKGGFEGGFHDDRASRIGAVLKIRQARAALEELLRGEKALKEASEAAEAQINEAVRELQALETEKAHLRQNGDQLGREIKSRARQLEVTAQGLESQRKGIQAMRAQLADATTQRDGYVAEQASPLTDKLSAAERATLSSLEERQRALQSALESLETETMTVTTTKDRLTADLHNNLLKRREELERLLSEQTDSTASGTDHESDLAALTESRRALHASYTSTLAELREIDAVIATKHAECAELEKQLESQRGEEQKQQAKIAEATKMLDKLLNKRSMLLETVQSRQRKMRDLGNLPAAELEEYRTLTEKQIMHRLNSVNEQLKKYSAVNRKALDQFLSFDKQREHLMERKEEMDTDGAAIQELIQSLDAQKDEAILRTFRGVSTHFAEVFSELVPGGAGQLVMRTSLDAASKKKSSSKSTSSNPDNEEEEEELQDHNLDEDGPDDAQALAISTFQGVQVRVSFSGAGQQYQMNQLSGGQKALVALALIFAIQRCDPAPFYLFDEIDQALDANYRAGVARLIQKQVNSQTAPAQFITTTFRPELVAVADRCYGIALQDRVSEIRSLEKFEAQKFVTDLMLEEEAVGPITAQPGHNHRGGHRGANNGGGAGGASRGSGAARGVPLQLRDELEAEEEDEGGEGSENEGEEGSGDEEDEEVTSPTKIRRIQRNTTSTKAGKAAQTKAAPKPRGKAAVPAKPTKAPAKGKGKGKAKGRGRAGKDSESDESSAGEGEGSGSEDEDREGRIELDPEEAAAFANLGLHDAEDDEE